MTQEVVTKPYRNQRVVDFVTDFENGTGDPPPVGAILIAMSEQTSQNPLVGLGALIPFDAIRAEHVEPAVTELLARARVEQAAIAQAPPTWAATAGALDALTADLEAAMGVVDHLESVLEDPALRAAHDAVRPAVSAFYADLSLDSGIYAALKAFAATEEATQLDPVRRRYLTETLAEFRRGGADLPAEQKDRLRALEVELAQVTTEYAHHVVDATDAWSLVITDEARLAGLPERAKAAARAGAVAQGVEGWRFTLHPPSVMPVLQFADDAGLRETLWRAYNTRATGGALDNRPLLYKILALRAEKARLLGYRDVADLFLEARMAGQGARARAFVDDLHARTRPFFEREKAELLAFRGGEGDLNPWDVAYLAEKLRRARYDLDSEALRPWFSADGVMHGIFDLISKLYGVTVKQITDHPTWHPDVKVYALEEGGRTVGVFYADLFPRAGKRGGAWMRPLFTGAPHAGGPPHVGLICGNLTPPLAPGEAALLTHQEVETIFHEMGHLLHHLFTEVSVRSLAGTSVAWDFVELPSQIMENWTWERPALDLFARHYQSGEPLPEDLFSRLCAAKNFRSGEAQMRQLGFATLDLALHRDYDPERDGDVLAYVRGIQQEFSTATLPDDFALVASFTHLFAHPTGYAAAYYSYKWAEVLDADAFSRFQAAGLFSAEEGARFRQHILARGGGADPAELFRTYMGRDPDPQALMERAGLG